MVITDAATEGEFRFERRKFGTLASDLQELAEWLGGGGRAGTRDGIHGAILEAGVAAVGRAVPVGTGAGTIQLCPARAQGGFRDAERLVRRHVAGELILSFVPHPEQRLWRTLTRSKHQLRRDRVRLQSQLEALMEDCRIKLASCVSDLLGSAVGGCSRG